MKYFAIILATVMVFSPAGQSEAWAKSKVGACPPGLAKKNPPCIPPGQAQKSYRLGDRYFFDDYLSDHDRRRYNLLRLPRGQSYYRVGDSFIRVVDETREVLEFFEALGRVLD
jgi:hypothetical protein